MASIALPILLLYVWWFHTDYTRVEATILSSKQDIELDNQLKLFNKSAVTTIHTKYGDKYDCVDFYKQPAFDHPALKNHNLHPKVNLNLYNKGGTNVRSSTVHTKFSKIWLNGKGCPIGTVPIKRTTKEDLIRIKEATTIYAKSYDLLTVEEPGTHYAMLHTNYQAGTTFNGAGMNVTVYNPHHVDESQYSSAQLKILNGPDSIEVGWTVNPSLYKDTLTRLFIYTRTSTSQCFNTYCPGFVYTRSDVPLDSDLAPTSKSGKKIFGTGLSIHRDPPTGNWVLRIDEDQTPIGYWPQQIFTGLKNLATYIEWGGKVYSPTRMPSPPMGAGYVLKDDTFYDAYCKQITVVDESLTIVPPAKTETFMDSNSYFVIDRGIDNPKYGYLILFGGLGGLTGN